MNQSEKRTLEESLEAQKIIFAVKEVMKNTALLDNIKSEKELDEVMPVLLASLGSYAQADRSYIFECKPGSENMLTMTYNWCDEGILPTIFETKGFPLSAVPNWFSILNDAGEVISYDWEADWEKWPEEYRLFSGQEIVSIVIMPIKTAGIVIGYIGIDNPARDRIELAVSLLRGISGHIGGLRENLAMMKKLEKNQLSLQQSLRELNAERDILDALSVDYTSVYYCDMMADTLIPIKCDDYNNAAAAVKEFAVKGGSYSFSMCRYYEQFVIKESAPDFLEKLNANYLREYLTNNKRFAYRYRVHPNKAGQQYFEVQIVKLPKSDGFKAVMGYRYVDDLVAKQEMQQTQLESALAAATLNSEIVGAISKLYWLIYRIDLVEKTYEEISATQETHILTGEKGYVVDILEKICGKIVSDEYSPRMREFWDISTLPERLKDTDSVSVEYQTRIGSWNLARFIAKKRDENGNVLHVLYVVRKIDEEKQKEIAYNQQLKKAADDARRANAAKTDFLRRMSHDIRTPINGIRGMLEIADHFPNDFEKQKECRKKLKEATGFLLDLVNNILDMNKLESGSVTLEHKPFDLLDVLHEIDDVTAMIAEDKCLHISIDHTKIKHRHLIGSSVHLKQILQNIAGNAAKYNREGGSIAFTAIETNCAKNTATYRLICSDTGYGMSEEFKAHAFEPFAQENEGARTSYMGTGLGLPIVKQLVEMMGGTIEVESEKNVGSTFTVTLSFEIDTQYKEYEHLGKENAVESLSGISVLLVEDNELNMEIAQFILENAGMKVTTAFNGKEAVDTFAASAPQQFDLILMDVMMPIMDGLTAAQIIRAMKREDAQRIPIFAMTANAFVDDIASCRKAGMNEHLAKPLDQAKLLNTIRDYISRK